MGASDLLAVVTAREVKQTLATVPNGLRYISDLRNLVASFVGPDVAPNAQDKHGRTILMKSLRLGDVELVRRLLTAFPETDCNLCDSHGRGPLDWIKIGIHQEKYTPRSVRQMLNLLQAMCPAPVPATDVLLAVLDRNWQPLHGHRLERYTSDFRVRWKTEEVLHHVQAIVADTLLSPGVDLNARNHAGATPLMLAARRGEPALIQQLVSSGMVNTNLVDIESDKIARGKRIAGGKTALMLALLGRYNSEYSWSFLPRIRDVLAIVELLAPLTDLTLSDTEGTCALSLAERVRDTCLRSIQAAATRRLLFPPLLPFPLEYHENRIARMYEEKPKEYYADAAFLYGKLVDVLREALDKQQAHRRTVRGRVRRKQ